MLARITSMLRESMFYSIPLFANRLLGFALLPVYTRYLSPADYGVLELLDLTISFIATIVWMRFSNAIVFYYFAAKTPEERGSVSSTAFAGATGVGLVFSSVLFFLAGPLSQLVLGSVEYTHFFRLVAIGWALSLPIEAGLTLSRAQNRSRAFAAVSVVRTGLMAVVNVVLLVAAHMGVAAMLWGAITASALISIYYVWDIYRAAPLRFNTGIFLNMARYALPLGVSGLATFFIHYGDRYFLRQTVTLSEIGIYSLAYKLGMMISFVHMPFNMYWNAQMFAVMRERDADRVYVRVATYLTFVLTYATLMVMVFAKALLRITAAPDFWPAAALVPFLAMAYLFRSLASHFMNLFLLEKKPGLEAETNLVSTAVCAAGYFVLIPPFGAWGAAWATLLTFAFMLVYAIYRTQRLRRFSLEYGRMLQLVSVAGFFAAAYYAIAPQSVWMQIAIALLIALAYPLTLMATGFFRHEEWKSIQGAWLSLRTRISPQQ